MPPKINGLRRANGKYAGKHVVDITDYKKESLLECSCGMMIQCSPEVAEAIADNHETNFNKPPEF